MVNGRLSTVNSFEIVTHSAEETMAFGRELARELEPPCVVLLEGELGSGKTTLVKGMVAGLGAGREDDVNSPTFTLVHEYGPGPGQTARPRKVYHVDLYRIDEARELSTLGLEEMTAENAVVSIEWGEKLCSPGRHVRVRFEALGADERRIRVERLEA